jgi:putative transcriptional regulator
VDVGQNVKRIREQQRYTQTEIARRCGVTPAAISGLEHGDFTPSTTLVIKIARALGVEPGELLKEPALAGKAEAPQETGQLGVEEGGAEDVEHLEHLDPTADVGKWVNEILWSYPFDDDEPTRKLEITVHDDGTTTIAIKRASHKHASKHVVRSGAAKKGVTRSKSGDKRKGRRA